MCVFCVCVCECVCVWVVCGCGLVLPGLLENENPTCNGWEKQCHPGLIPFSVFCVGEDPQGSEPPCGAT